MRSCREAEAYVREQALARMNAAVDLNQAEEGCWEAEAAVSDAGAGGDSAKDFSTTNNQVSGVDEADFIKNDGKYVYAALNGAFRIIEAWPADQAREIASVKLAGTAKKLFVSGDRALVYVAKSRGESSGSAPYHGSTECTYGYDCEPAGDGTATDMVLFDISDRKAPKQLRRLELSGSLLAARRIGDAVHTVVVTPELIFPGVSYDIPSSLRCAGHPSKQAIDNAFAKLRAANRKIILEADLDDFIPSVREGREEFARQGCQSLYREHEPSGAAFTSVVSLDLNAGEAPTVATVISGPGAVYASADSLYMAVRHVAQTPAKRTSVPSRVVREPSSPELSSVIHKFHLGDQVGDTRYVATGKIEGRVLNQFSMDEHDGHLRVATSVGWTPDPNVHSTLNVLREHDGELELVGKLDDIAPTEDIRSMRFDGDRGFMVTFKKTDPLYVFDLSQPRVPAILGELKIPGFSTYMHMLDDQHLLTIGYDAADQGNFAYFTGVLLQIFDVSDPGDPQLAHKTVIGTRGSSSEALTNHLAFTLFQNKLAVPMTICEGGNTSGGYGSDMTFSGLIVFDISVEEGIHERGRIAHPGEQGGYDNSGCSNWWANASSVVQRSLFMDDFVYSVAPRVMHVQNVNALGTDVSVVPLDR